MEIRWAINRIFNFDFFKYFVDSPKQKTQMCLRWAGTAKHLKNVLLEIWWAEEEKTLFFKGPIREISDIAKFAEALLNNLRSSKTLLTTIKEKAALDEDMEKSIIAVIEEVIKDFI